MFDIAKKYYHLFFNFIHFIPLVIISSCLGSVGEFQLNSPYWYINIDRAGYVDYTFYYPSPRHLASYHEMMTGDWAAAVWYPNIPTGTQAAWLTNRFIAPTCYTQQNFDFSKTDAYNVEDYLWNPVWFSDTDPVPTYRVQVFLPTPAGQRLMILPMAVNCK